MTGQSDKRAFFVFFCLIASIFINNTEVSAFDHKTSVVLSRYIIAGMYEKMGDIDKAIQEYTKALKLDYKNAAIHSSLASSYLKKNKINEAIEELNLAVKFDPDAIEPHVILALLYFSQEKLTEAGHEYEKALQNAAALEPNNLNIYKKLGALYLQQKNFTAAEKTFKLILGLSEQDLEAHFYLANIYDEQKNREAAIKELKKVLELKPDYHQALNYLGYIYVEQDRNLDEASALIKKALEIEPDNGAYIDSLGWLFFKQGKLKEAIKELERAIGLLEDPVIYDHLGEAYFRNKDSLKAKANWEKALKLDPSMDSVKKKLEGLRQ